MNGKISNNKVAKLQLKATFIWSKDTFSQKLERAKL